MDQDTATGVALSAILVAVGVGCVVQYFTDDITLVIGLGLLTSVSFGMALSWLIAVMETEEKK
jgi:hypothetical protein